MSGRFIPPQPVDKIVSLKCHRELRGRLPRDVAVENMRPSVGCRTNGPKRKARLNGNRIRGGDDYFAVWMFLSEIIVNGPGDVLCGFCSEAEQLVLETVGGLDLVRTVDQPIVHRELVRDWNTGPDSHVVEGEEVKPVGSGVVDLVFGVVSFDTQRAAPLAEIDVDTFPDGNDVGAVGLENIAINLRPRLVGGISLQSVGRLPKLQIQARAPSAAGGRIGRAFKHDAGLTQTDLVA